LKYTVAVAIVGTVSIGAITMSWYAASGTAHASTQVSWIKVSTGALLVAAGCCSAWLLAGERAVRQRIRFLITTGEHTWPLSPPMALEATANLEPLVSAPRMSTYHRATCMLVAGKTLTHVGTNDDVVTRLRPCPVCCP
jgi:hypothetical protein